MIRRMRWLLASWLLVVVCIPPLHAAAQVATQGDTTNSALQVGPAITEQVLTPGEPKKFTIQLKNITNFPLPIKGFVRDMNPDASKLPEAERQRLDASKWFTIIEPDFILQPNQIRTIQVQVTAPPKVTPGGHYATIYFQPLVPEAALSATTAYISSRVGVLAFLVVKGDLKQALTVSKPLTAPTLQRHGPIDLSVTIHNSGNVHVMPTGAVRIFNWRGQEVAKLPLPPGVILPDTSKTYTLQWKTNDIMGSYRAELDAVYGDEQTILQSKLSYVWIIPWIEALAVIGVVSLWLFMRHRTRRRWRKAWRAFKGR